MIAVATLALTGACLLALTVTSDNGTVTGHVYWCGNEYGFTVACSPGKPVNHAGVLFERTSDKRQFWTETDSKGAYSIRLGPAQYRVKYRIVGSAQYNDAGKIYIGDWGVDPISITMHAREQLVLDLKGGGIAQ